MHSTTPVLQPPDRSSSYWRQSRQPLASLIFVAPLLVLYEGGMLISGPQALRNGADVWLRQLLDLLGFGQFFLLPVLTAIILLAWHHTTGSPWRTAPRVFYGMLAESAVLSICLVILARLQGELLGSLVGLDVSGAPGHGFWSTFLAFVGAGIYEEVLFRLILLSVVAGLLRMAGAFFATLFVLRGFGVAVGAHAGYDILVGLLLRQA